MRTAALGEVATINPRGDTPGMTQAVSFVGMAELDAQRGIALPLETRVFAEVSKGYTVFRDRDVLAAKITPCWENGKVGQALLDHPIGVGSTEFHVVRPSSELDDRYVLHYLRQPSVRLAGEMRMTGSAGQKRVPTAFLKELAIPLPPLPEQRRIAAILDHADALRAKRRQVLAHLETLTQSIFHDMFATNLATVPLGESLTFVTSGGRGWAKYYSTNGDRFIRSLDVQMGTIGDRDPVFVSAPMNAEARRTRTQSGDVLLTITGSRIGRVAAIPSALSGAYISQHVAILRPDAELLSPEFLAAMLALPDLGQRLIAGAQYGQTKPGLNFEQIRRFSLPRPPLQRQAEFARRIWAANVLRRSVHISQRSDDELFASLQAEAFRGGL